mmetsp:Transcript_14872/g.42085  ORF Transcript_14872/g.42085 Transcript_14872/m.42085 type:complete len:225 (+) Transcript_14872:238-912(+)
MHYFPAAAAVADVPRPVQLVRRTNSAREPRLVCIRFAGLAVGAFAVLVPSCPRNRYALRALVPAAVRSPNPCPTMSTRRLPRCCLDKGQGPVHDDLECDRGHAHVHPANSERQWMEAPNRPMTRRCRDGRTMRSNAWNFDATPVPWPALAAAQQGRVPALEPAPVRGGRNQHHRRRRHRLPLRCDSLLQQLCSSMLEQPRSLSSHPSKRPWLPCRDHLRDTAGF